MGAVLSDRDYVHLQSHGPDVLAGHQRVYVVVSSSVDRSDCRHVKGLVRGCIEFEGLVVEQDADDELACVVTRIVSIDQKGWIPSMLVRSFVSDRQTSILTAVAESLHTSVESVAL